jgi:nitrous oxide reductase accessory protein NosL
VCLGDNASPAESKPLVLVDKATFLIGSKLPTVMTRVSKTAFGTLEAARAAQAANGGELTDFDGALLATYTEVAEGIKSNRATIVERLKRAQQQQDQKPEQKQDQ